VQGYDSWWNELVQGYDSWWNELVQAVKGGNNACSEARVHSTKNHILAQRLSMEY
jgi:hypothetical protein